MSQYWGVNPLERGKVRTDHGPVPVGYTYRHSSPGPGRSSEGRTTECGTVPSATPRRSRVTMTGVPHQYFGPIQDRVGGPHSDRQGRESGIRWRCGGLTVSGRSVSGDTSPVPGVHSQSGVPGRTTVVSEQGNTHPPTHPLTDGGLSRDTPVV